MPVNNISCTLQRSVDNNSIHNRRTPEFAVSTSCREGISVYSINIQSLSAKHLAELNFYMQIHRPHIVLLQETWLDDTVEDVKVAGYRQVSRRDRKGTANRGGILTLQRDDFNSLVHIKNSATDERS